MIDKCWLGDDDELKTRFLVVLSLSSFVVWLCGDLSDVEFDFAVTDGGAVCELLLIITAILICVFMCVNCSITVVATAAKATVLHNLTYMQPTSQQTKRLFYYLFMIILHDHVEFAN